ncbi:hypothetical protein ACHQM5_001465 [Ranunculus cassubicifolius]
MRRNFISFALLVSSLFSLVSSQSDSCASNLNINGVFSFNTITLPCYSVWNSQDFLLRFSQTQPNIWSFVLSAPNTNAYISIGFSSNGRMVGSSALAGWITPNGVGVLKQYYLGGKKSRQCVPDQGSLPVVYNSTTIISQSSRLYIAFQLNTSQPESRLIYAVGPRNRFPSSDNMLAEHKDYTDSSLNYASGQTTSAGAGQSTTLKRAHGALCMFGWGILLWIGIMAARYLKEMDPFWFYCHLSLQSLGFILGVGGIIAGFALEDSLDVEVDKHKNLGIFILVLGSLQVLAILARPDKTSKVRKYWNWYHYSIGRLTIFLSIGNIFYGIDVGNEVGGWNVGYGIILAVLVLIAVVLEIRMRMRK